MGFDKGKCWVLHLRRNSPTYQHKDGGSPAGEELCREGPGGLVG